MEAGKENAMGVKKQLLQEEGKKKRGVVAVNPKPRKGLVSATVDLIERVIVFLMHDAKTPLQYLAGNFAPVRDETPPFPDLPVRGTLPGCLNGEFVRVGSNPKFVPVAGCHWFDGDGYVLYGHFVLSSLINYSAIQRVLLDLVVTISNRKK